MSNPSHLIIGLGNPGDDYARTRHNIGFMALDKIALHYRCPVWKKKFRGQITSAENFFLLKPQTFMNVSGEAAIEALNFYQLTTERVIVFHDDLDLAAGHVKIKQGGGSGGHNGLKSLDAHLGQNYWRVRIGIGRPMTEQGEYIKGDAVTHYVLNAFSKADKLWLEPLLNNIALHFDLLLRGQRTDYVAKLPKT